MYIDCNETRSENNIDPIANLCFIIFITFYYVIKICVRVKNLNTIGMNDISQNKFSKILSLVLY